jgi:hypothetical protein
MSNLNTITLKRLEIFTDCYPAQWPRRAEVALIVFVAALAILLPIPVRAQTETVLYNFTYPPPPTVHQLGPSMGSRIPAFSSITGISSAPLWGAVPA